VGDEQQGPHTSWRRGNAQRALGDAVASIPNPLRACMSHPPARPWPLHTDPVGARQPGQARRGGGGRQPRQRAPPPTPGLHCRPLPPHTCTAGRYPTPASRSREPVPFSALGSARPSWRVDVELLRGECWWWGRGGLGQDYGCESRRRVALLCPSGRQDLIDKRCACSLLEARAASPQQPLLTPSCRCTDTGGPMLPHHQHRPPRHPRRPHKAGHAFIHQHPPGRVRPHSKRGGHVHVPLPPQHRHLQLQRVRRRVAAGAGRCGEAQRAIADLSGRAGRWGEGERGRSGG
jgi:hypothetical protein